MSGSLVLVCGSRNYPDLSKVRARVALLPPGTVVLHGGAHGADRAAGDAARAAGLKVREMRADWLRYGKAAGLIRNVAMLDQKPDRVMAFWDGRSPGTRHTIKHAEERGIPVETIPPGLTTPDAGSAASNSTGAVAPPREDASGAVSGAGVSLEETR